MSRFSEKAIEEQNRQRELQMDIDYSCVQFGKWITERDEYTILEYNLWLYSDGIELFNNRTYTTEELYQIYKNTKDNV